MSFLPTFEAFNTFNILTSNTPWFTLRLSPRNQIKLFKGNILTRRLDRTIELSDKVSSLT